MLTKSLLNSTESFNDFIFSSKVKKEESSFIDKLFLRKVNVNQGLNTFKLILFPLSFLMFGYLSNCLAQSCPPINNNKVDYNGIHSTICFYDEYDNELGSCLDCQFVDGTWHCGVEFNYCSNFYRATIGGVDCFNATILSTPFSSLQATNFESGIKISWVSNIESHINYYSVEKSVNGVDFIEVGKVYCVDNYSAEKMYELVDQNAIIGTSYYRLSQTNYNGLKTVLQTIAFENKSKDNVSIYPNPATSSEVNVSFTFVESYNIVSSTGKVLFFGTEKDNTVDLSKFSNGTYFVKFIFKNGNSTEKMLMVSK